MWCGGLTDRRVRYGGGSRHTHTHRDEMGRGGEMRDAERKAMEKGKLSLRRKTWDGTREGQ